MLEANLYIITSSDLIGNDMGFFQGLSHLGVVFDPIESYAICGQSFFKIQITYNPDSDKLLLGYLLTWARLHGWYIYRQKYKRPMVDIKFAAFDLDGTIIVNELMSDLAKAKGCSKDMNFLTEETMSGYLPFTESYRLRLKMLKGITYNDIKMVCNDIVFASGFEHLFNYLKSKDVLMYLITGGWSIFCDYVRETYPFDGYIASCPVFENDVFVGMCNEPLVDEEAKARFFSHILESHNIEACDTFAMGDGANDILMLSISDHAFLYSAVASTHFSHIPIDSFLAICREV